MTTSTMPPRTFLTLIAEYVPRTSDSGIDTNSVPMVIINVGPKRRRISEEMSNPRPRTTSRGHR